MPDDTTLFLPLEQCLATGGVRWPRTASRSRRGIGKQLRALRLSPVARQRPLVVVHAVEQTIASNIDRQMSHRAPPLGRAASPHAGHEGQNPLSGSVARVQCRSSRCPTPSAEMTS